MIAEAAPIPQVSYTGSDMATPQKSLDRYAEQQRREAEGSVVDMATYALVADPATKYVVLHTIVGLCPQSTVRTAEQLGITGEPSNPASQSDIEANLLRLMRLGAIRPLKAHEHEIAEANAGKLPGVRYVGAVAPTGDPEPNLLAQAAAYRAKAEKNSRIAAEEVAEKQRREEERQILLDMAKRGGSTQTTEEAIEVRANALAQKIVDEGRFKAALSEEDIEALVARRVEQVLQRVMEKQRASDAGLSN